MCQAVKRRFQVKHAPRRRPEVQPLPRGDEDEQHHEPHAAERHETVAVVRVFEIFPHGVSGVSGKIKSAASRAKRDRNRRNRPTNEADTNDWNFDRSDHTAADTWTNDLPNFDRSYLLCFSTDSIGSCVILIAKTPATFLLTIAREISPHYAT